MAERLKAALVGVGQRLGHALAPSRLELHDARDALGNLVGERRAAAAVLAHRAPEPLQASADVAYLPLDLQNLVVCASYVGHVRADAQGYDVSVVLGQAPALLNAALSVTLYPREAARDIPARRHYAQPRGNRPDGHEGRQHGEAPQGRLTLTLRHSLPPSVHRVSSNIVIRSRHCPPVDFRTDSMPFATPLISHWSAPSGLVPMKWSSSRTFMVRTTLVQVASGSR